MKIQVRYLLFAVIALALSVMALYMHHVTPSSNGVGIFTWGISVLVSLVGFFYQIYKTILWNERARRFKSIFGINPPNDPNMDWKVLRALQPVVDEHLKVQAGYLNRAYEVENKILVKAPQGVDEAKERAEKIAVQATEVEQEKRIFWGGHNLAWEWGFEVYGDYQSYLEKNTKGTKNKKKF